MSTYIVNQKTSFSYIYIIYPYVSLSVSLPDCVYVCLTCNEEAERRRRHEEGKQVQKHEHLVAE